MATYYVSPHGLDTNTGTGPGAAAAWKTIGKALGSAGIASGDTVYIAPGTYRETVTVAMTSATATTRVLGDVANESGFTDGSGNRLAGGDVIWTAYTTNDTTTPASTVLLDLAGRDFLAFEHFVLIGGNADPAVVTAAATSTDIAFRDCFIQAGRTGVFSLLNMVVGFGIAANWVIERCVIHFTSNSSTRGALQFNLTRGSSGGDYDTNIQVRNCLFLGGHSCVYVNSAGGSGTIYGGGIDLDHCTFLHIGSGACLRAVSSNLSTSIPLTMQNCLAIGSQGNIMQATALGVVVDAGYNVALGLALSTVTQAGTTIADTTAFTIAPLLEFGHAWLNGRAPRPFATPMAGSPFLGRTGGVSLTSDFLERPRPSGATTNTVGALGRHDTAQRETTTVRTGSTALRIDGPGDQEFQIPVAATATTISIYARYNSAHTGSLPIIEVLNGEECGVANANAVMTSAADTWEQLSLSFTPARAGIVTLRLRSRSTASGGAVFWDDYSFTG